MNQVLFAAALLMTCVAVAFATTPLIMSYRRRNSGSAALSLLAIIVGFGLGIGLYGVIGKPELSTAQPVAAASASTMQATQPDTGNEKAGSVTSLLAGLEARLAENPDDAKGWLLLAKSYDHLGRGEDARAAYDKAAALGMTDAALESRLQESSATITSSAAEIRGRVSVADAVAGRVDPGDVVYVVAKMENNPMPLAVLRRSASELPFDFVLSDENSMVQGGGISSAGSVVVAVRLSKTGDALNTAAELAATSGAIDPQNAAELSLVIDVAAGD